MQTYNKIVVSPLLEIRHDNDIESPREWNNLGYFITSEHTPDGQSSHAKWVQSIVESTSKDANNQDEHTQLIVDAINATSETVVAIYSVNRYEHGNVVYSRGIVNDFDYSNCGFYIVTDKTLEVIGIPNRLIEKTIDSELETYTSYVNGDVYEFILHDETGEVVDSCSGFYDIEDMREYLPESYKGENLYDYLVYS
jgi:hypothetical protein